MVAQGTTLAGRYRLDARLGAGGMGEVWRGEDTVLARTVAIKVLLPGRLEDPGFAARFHGEARAMATINHPGVVDVYDYGVTEVPGDGSTAYLVMRFVDGEPLDRLLIRLGRIPPEATMELIAQAASALQAVHERGIVHRDVKPGNLLVQADGTLVLTDFGIARADNANRLTDAGMVLGTAAYCAPEQAEGRPVTPAVDIYALGVVAYECLSGQRPFDGDTPVTIALKHIREEPPPLPPDVPAPARHVVERALAKDPGSRWPDAATMSAAARQAKLLINGGALPPGAPPQSVPPVPPPGPGLAGMSAGVTTVAHQPFAPAPGPRQPPSVPAPGTVPSPPTLPPKTGAPQPGPQPASGRRTDRSQRGRAPLVVGVAVAAALVGGLGAFGLSSLANTAAGEEDPVGRIAAAASPSPTVAETVREAQVTRSPRPRRTPVPRQVTETSGPRPTPSPSAVAEPSPSPAQPSPRPSPTPSPSPTPTKSAAPVKVPAVVGLTMEEGLAAIRKAGLRPKMVVSDDPDQGLCTKVLSQDPAAGTVVKPGETVTVVVDRGAKCPDSPPAVKPAEGVKQ